MITGKSSMVLDWKNRLLVFLSVVLVASGNLCLRAQKIDQYKTPEGRLIQLRNQLEKAQNVGTQKKILQEIGQTGTFIGMTTAAKFLNVKGLEKTAAQAVADIALKHKEYDGINTRQWLVQSMEILGGSSRKAIEEYLQGTSKDEAGFVSIFNGKDLSGSKGLVENPIKRASMTSDELAKAQVKADETMRKDWKVENGLLAYVGSGFDNICTVRPYADFEMYVDWKLDPNGKEPDAGIYLRGTPQVQIWDIARVNVGAQVGSGGLYNNQKHESKPLQVADNKLGEWNSFYIKMVGDKVTVKLNGVTVVDNVVLENYWNRNLPIFPVEQLELQAHGSLTYFRDIYVKDLK